MADVVIVTGASKGIGRQVCIELLAAYPTITVVATARSEELLAELQTQTDAERLVPVAGDIAQDATRQQVIRIAKTHGRIRALVNNAARMAPTGRVLEIPPEEWQATWTTNFLAAQALIYGTADHLLDTLHSGGGNGRIINVTSSTSKGAVRGVAVYGSTKVALNYLTQSIALEYPQITAVAFYPGVVRTAMNKDALVSARKYEAVVGSDTMAEVIHKLEAPIDVQRPAAIIANLAMRADSALSGKYLVHSDAEIEPYAQ
ncbi:hypothetical protein GGI11_004848 [Coemansia sp. RSA 2049]|nr:hypothetical protein GGI11_004848 [Coemansia sp. RSA 2049]KAJ2520985.1 hypothetical protein H4217_001693 [Coemansia sp. RSA 1939]KAJ2683108.1 hypothetical protein GGH99_004479 [Coemansia sp. RSA 1285]